MDVLVFRRTLVFLLSVRILTLLRNRLTAEKTNLRRVKKFFCALKFNQRFRQREFMGAPTPYLLGELNGKQNT